MLLGAKGDSLFWGHKSVRFLFDAMVYLENGHTRSSAGLKKRAGCLFAKAACPLINRDEGRRISRHRACGASSLPFPHVSSPSGTPSPHVSLPSRTPSPPCAE